MLYHRGLHLEEPFLHGTYSSVLLQLFILQAARGQWLAFLNEQRAFIFVIIVEYILRDLILGQQLKIITTADLVSISIVNNCFHYFLFYKLLWCCST